MTRPFRKLVLAFGALALAATPAWAQQGRGFGMMGGSPFFLMAPNVQKDLKLTDEQVGKVQDVLTESREKHQDDYAALREVPPEERAAKIAAVSKTVNDEVKKALSLSDDQSKRFDQIALQQRGLQAFMDPAVASKLKLTDDQTSQIREIQQATMGALRGVFNKDASADERAEAMRKMAAARKESLTKVHALLTDDQKKTWKEMTGEPIEIAPLRRPNRAN